MARDIILFDLDGTLADCSHRLHHITTPEYVVGSGPIPEGTKKNWKAFFADCYADKPIEHAIQVANALAAHGFLIWITSGRSDEVRAETEEWLAQHRVDYHHLIMRKAGDHTDDGLLKPSWLEDGTIDKERVLLAFDDRNRVVEACAKAAYESIRPPMDYEEPEVLWPNCQTYYQADDYRKAAKAALSTPEFQEWLKMEKIRHGVRVLNAGGKK